jgi:hypothetical protein
VILQHFGRFCSRIKDFLASQNLSYHHARQGSEDLNLKFFGAKACGDFNRERREAKHKNSGKGEVKMSRKFFVGGIKARELVLFIVFALLFTTIANSQKVKCKKWTYDFSETVKYFDTVEATNDAETFRCSADDTYIGVVYKRECASCCKPLESISTLLFPNLPSTIFLMRR